MSRHGLHRIARPRAPREAKHRTHPHFSTLHATGEERRALKRAMMRDCRRRCVYCACTLTWMTATLDHVLPRSRGGGDDLGNVVAACASCNELKRDLLPQEFFFRCPWAGLNFLRYARCVHRAHKRCARRAVSLAFAQRQAA